MKVGREDAAGLCDARTIAIVGASQKPVRPVYGVMAYLLKAGFQVFPVNPGLAGQQLMGQRVFARLRDIPEKINVVNIFRRQDALSAVVDEALSLLPIPAMIWMQLNLVDEAAAARARQVGVTVVMDRCTMVEHLRFCR